MSTAVIGRVPLLAVGLLLLSVGAPEAAAERYVGVLDIRGPGSKRVRRFIEEQIDKRWNLVSRRELLDAAEDLEISKKRMKKRRNLRRIARKAKCDAVITGYVYRARRRWWLVVQVKDGATGRTVGRTVIRYTFFRLNKWSKRSIMKAVARGVRRVEGVPHPRRRRAVVETPVRPVETPKKKKPSLNRRPYFTGVEFAAGVEIWGRRLSFVNLNAEPGRQLLYETNSPVVPISLNLEVYPGAFVTGHKHLANIGLGIFFRRAFGVVSQREGDATEITTTIQRVGGHLLYRLFLKDKAESPVFKFMLGVDAIQFKFGVDLDEVTSVTYITFKPGVKLVLPLGSERFRLGFWAAGLIALQLGQMQDAYHYGAARAGGIDVGVEFDVRLFWKIHLLAGAFTTWMFVSFTQSGVQHVDYEYIADSATDGYFGGYLHLALHY